MLIVNVNVLYGGGGGGGDAYLSATYIKTHNTNRDYYPNYSKMRWCLW